MYEQLRTDEEEFDWPPVSTSSRPGTNRGGTSHSSISSSEGARAPLRGLDKPGMKLELGHSGTVRGGGRARK